MSSHSYHPISKKIKSIKSVTHSILDFGTGNKLELSKTEDIIRALDDVSKEVSDEFHSESEADKVAFELQSPESDVLLKASSLIIAKKEEGTSVKKPGKTKKSKNTSDLKPKKVKSQRKSKISIDKGPEIPGDKRVKTFKSMGTIRSKTLASVEERLVLKSKNTLDYDHDLKNNYTSIAEELGDIVSENSVEGVSGSESCKDS
jgi:hypothetical protein